MCGRRTIAAFCLCIAVFLSTGFRAQANVSITAPSAILIEASTGQIIFEQNATERRSPASITKIMTLLLAFEQLEAGKISLDDQVTTSEYASSMGGSQVFLAAGEVQTLDTMLKCIAVASGNDASVAVAEHIAGSEAAFVEMMNGKAAELGMTDTHFEDCCGLTDSDNHYSSAKDIAIMSRELITKYPKVFDYTTIWMEDITHVTKQGSSTFTLTSTNKLLKQYQWTTGLKTGSTSKAKYCVSATASKDGIDLIAVIMAAPDYKTRFEDAVTLLNYGFGRCRMYRDEEPPALPQIPVENGVEESVGAEYAGIFSFLGINGESFSDIERELELPEAVEAPVKKGDVLGYLTYRMGGEELGRIQILASGDVKEAGYLDYLKQLLEALRLA